MIPGKIGVVMDEHVGLGDDSTSYALHPGDSGLIIENDLYTTTLLISGHIIYVRTDSLQTLEG